MQLRSHAKINWSLRITGKREDGFHDLETLFQTISLHDTLTIERAARYSLVCDDPTIPTDDSNLVLRAAHALEPYGAGPVAIDLRKQIPAGGGLGGGSSNAAATLIAMAELFGIDIPLAAIALELGSDVPFFLVGGTAYATGRGEVLTPLMNEGGGDHVRVSGIPLLLLLPEERVLTGEAFRLLRTYSAPLGVERYRTMVEGDFLSHASELTNDFEEPIFARLPRLALLKQRLLDVGAAWASMTGSGSTIVGAFRDAAARDEAMTSFRDVRAVAGEAT